MIIAISLGLISFILYIIALFPLVDFSQNTRRTLAGIALAIALIHGSAMIFLTQLPLFHISTYYSCIPIIAFLGLLTGAAMYFDNIKLAIKEFIYS